MKRVKFQGRRRRSEVRSQIEHRAPKSQAVAQSAPSVLDRGNPQAISTRVGSLRPAQSTGLLAQFSILRISRLLVCLPAVLGLAGAAELAIPWWTLEGGGGVSRGDGFTVRGTVSQPGAGRMSGGGFTVTGGFWAWPLLIPGPGAPVLTIAYVNPGQAVLTWEAVVPGWMLQEAVGVNGPWLNMPGGASSPVTAQATSPARFYRLLRP